MAMTRQPTLTKPATGRTVAIVGDVYRFLAVGEDTDGRYALFEAVVAPGGGPPPHVHSREEEGFYVLEGEVTFLAGEERIVAGPGVFINMPVGTQHTFKNESGQPARMLISVAPAGLERPVTRSGSIFVRLTPARWRACPAGGSAPASAPAARPWRPPPHARRGRWRPAAAAPRAAAAPP